MTHSSPENAIEWIARSTAPLHAALKKYPDAFEALHFLFNEMNHPRAISVISKWLRGGNRFEDIESCGGVESRHTECPQGGSCSRELSSDSAASGQATTAGIAPGPQDPSPEPVAWRWQVYGIWHYTGGFPVSGAEPLYLRPENKGE